jgi:hypothetical protein
MTNCPGGDFFDFLAYRGSVTEEEARVLFLQVFFYLFLLDTRSLFEDVFYGRS